MCTLTKNPSLAKINPSVAVKPVQCNLDLEGKVKMDKATIKKKQQKKKQSSVKNVDIIWTGYIYIGSTESGAFDYE